MPIRDFVEHAASKENLDLRNNWTIVGTYGPIVQDNLGMSSSLSLKLCNALTFSGLKLVIKPSDNHPLLKPFSALSVSGGVPFKDRSSHEHEPTSDQFANQHNSLFGSGTLMTQLNWNSESFAPTEQDKLKQGIFLSRYSFFCACRLLLGTPVFNLHKHARS